MFRKILIIEDIDSVSLGIITTLEKQFTADIRSTKYCDEAFLKIKKAMLENAPFDLVITDLSFKEDHRETKITSGTGLIEVIRKEQPDVNIIVYSVEDRPYVINSLFRKYGINAYVEKGRESSQELLEAIHTLYHSESKYLSPHLTGLLKDNTMFEIDDYDVQLLKDLSEGLTQEEISLRYRTEGKVPSSTSGIEKRINKLKIFFKANNTIHLVAIAKDMGII